MLHNMLIEVNKILGKSIITLPYFLFGQMI
nr:MAG TPA: hypothetical protein [Caudoviricetes sp.]